MKFVKKLTALFLAVCMVMAMGITAFAADQKFTITAPNNGHTYEIYQIFYGDLKEDSNTGSKVLSNIKWGANGTGTKDAAVDETVITNLNKKEDPTDPATLADLKGNAYASVTSGNSVEVPAGYYLIKDMDGSYKDKDDSYTKYIVQVVGNTTITPKTDKPTFEKKVKDKNDSTGRETDWQDSADYDIGDTIPYRLTATMGDLTHYDTYYVQFVDTMTNLTYEGITSVKVGDKTLENSQYTVDWNAESKTLKVAITDVKIYGARKDTEVVVEYTATLDKSANIGSVGNPNVAYLRYSNNPNNSGDGETGETPKDKNIVFTYKVDVNKVTGEGANQKPLAGAKFKLYKWQATTNTSADGYKNGYAWIQVGSETEATGSAETKFTASWSGIDDGKYKLVESDTPPGYSTINPIEFTVTASHDKNSDDPKLTELDGGDLGDGNISTGTITGTVINKPGSSLPETGGMGTTVIYIAGIAMIVAAGVVVIARKRMA